MLSDTKIRAAQPREKPYKISDSGGLYIEVSITGARLWRQKYRFGGKEKLLSHGRYPEVGLKTARDLALAARELLAKGVDPGAVKKAAKAGLNEPVNDSFQVVAMEWLEKRQHEWTDKHVELVTRRMGMNLFPFLGGISIGKIDVPMLLPVLQKIEARDALEVANRTKQHCSCIFRYAIAKGLCTSDPAAMLSDALKKPVRKNYSTIARGGLPELLKDIEGYQGKPLTIYALRLMAHTFVRTGELLDAEWREFDLKKKEWVIPAARMKMRLPHLVPLSKQVIVWLKELHKISGHREHLFPNRNDPTRHASHAVILRALDRMGWGGEMTGHGFRSVASTHLNENKSKWKIHKDTIEMQLSHVEQSGSRAAYNFAEYLGERVLMMQRWSDYLGEQAKVI